LRAVFGFAIVTAACLSAFQFLRLVDLSATETGTWLSLLGGVLAGIYVADFATGVVHWACDTWGDARTPWVGPGLIASFREHHRDPGGMLAHDWIEVNGEVAIAASIALALMTLPFSEAWLNEHSFAAALGWAAISCSALANQLHQWAHRPNPSRVIRGLQNAGLILSRERHRTHHRAPNTRGYCISTGWSNALLDAIGFWRGLEHGITRLTGAQPRAHALDEIGSPRG
jgi:hypothetical protein